MNHLFKLRISLFLICLLIVVKPAKAQSAGKCYPIADTFTFPQLFITDSTFATILDSAISMIKVKPIREYSIPYLIELRPGKNIGQQRCVELNARDNYGIESAGKEGFGAWWSTCMVIQRGKYQVMVDTSGFKDSWFSEYLKPSNVMGPYYAYGFYMNQGKSKTCELIPPTFQEVTFRIRPDEDNKFTFEKYVLRVIN